MNKEQRDKIKATVRDVLAVYTPAGKRVAWTQERQRLARVLRGW